MRIRQLGRAVAVVAIAALAAAPLARADVPGHIVVVDTFADAVYDYPPDGGTRTPITTGGDFEIPEGIVRLGRNDYLVADRGPTDGAADGLVIRVRNGDQTVLASGAPLVDPHAIDLSSDRRTAYVGSRDGSIVAVSIATGAKRTVSSGELNDVRALAVERTGALLAVDTNFDPTSKVVRMNPASGAFGTVATGAPLDDPRSLLIRPGGDLLIGDQDSTGPGAALLRVVPPGPTATVFNDGSAFGGASVPGGLALDQIGRVVVSDRNNPASAGCTGNGGCGRILRVSPDGSGVVELVSADSQELSEAAGIALVPPRCGGRDATVVGTLRRDQLVGTRFADVIFAGGGRDVVRGLRRGDVACGGGGADRLIGGPGADRLIGGKGRDRLRGGPGRDRLVGGPGRDKLRGGPGRDFQKQ